jgi:hypothetical protein
MKNPALPPFFLCVASQERCSSQCQVSFAYLLRIIEKALNVEFNQMATARTGSAPAVTSHAAKAKAPPPKPHSPSNASKVIASQHMAALMGMMGRHGSGEPARDG